MSKLSIQGVEKRFAGRRGQAGTQALEPVSVDVADNDFITILGPSGCGKSTLLRIVAGLEEPSAGQVLLDGKAVRGPGADRGMVFQSYTLFPWLTVAENIGFGLRERGVARDEREGVVQRFIDQVGLRGFERHYPKMLSGGMQQRTAIARALANDPKILLLDEPAGGLNHEEVYVLGDLIRKIRDDRKITVLLVEHHMGLVMSIADHVVALNFGRKLAEGTPAQVQADPDVIKAYLGSKDQ